MLALSEGVLFDSGQAIATFSSMRPQFRPWMARSLSLLNDKKLLDFATA